MSLRDEKIKSLLGINLDDLKKIGFYLLLSIVFSVLSYYVFQGNIWIGTFLLMVFLGMIIVSEKKDFKQLIKR